MATMTTTKTLDMKGFLTESSIFMASPWLALCCFTSLGRDDKHENELQKQMLAIRGKTANPALSCPLQKAAVQRSPPK